MKIKLMADYGCFPLWYNELDKVGNINPCTLPLSEETQARLRNWEKTYNSFLDWSDPGHSPLTPQESWEAFIQEGKELLKLLQKELGPDYQITLYDH